MNTSSAIIYGATGAVGSELLKRCLDDTAYDSVVVLARNPATIQHDKLTWLTAPLEQLRDAVREHQQIHAYCCIGSTLKQAGNKDKFRQVDYDLAVEFASHCRAIGVTSFCAISSLGADPKSSNYYKRTKGEMEAALIALKFKSLKIVRPSLLDTRREPSRPAERIGTFILKGLSPLLFGGLQNLKPITPRKVAIAMRSSSQSNNATLSILTNRELHQMSV